MVPTSCAAFGAERGSLAREQPRRVPLALGRVQPDCRSRERRAQAVGPAADLHGSDQLQAVHGAPAEGADLGCLRGLRIGRRVGCPRLAAPAASPPGVGRGGGEARTGRRQTRGQLTTRGVFVIVTWPAAAAFLIAAYDLSRCRRAPDFQVTLLIDQSGG